MVLVRGVRLVYAPTGAVQAHHRLGAPQAQL